MRHDPVGPCLCPDCCAKARSFGYGHWGLDRANVTRSGVRSKPLMSRAGRWRHTTSGPADNIVR